MAYVALNKSESDPGKPIKASWGDQVADNFSYLHDLATGLSAYLSVFSVFGGDGSDTAGPSTTTSVTIGTSGKQYTSWSVAAGQTITIDPSTDGVARIGVQGTLTLTATSTIQAVAQGADGGAGGAINVTGSAGTSNLRTGLGCPTAGGGGASGEQGSGAPSANGPSGGAGGTALSFAASPGGVGPTSYGNANGNPGSSGTAAYGYGINWWLNPAFLQPSPGGGGGGGSLGGAGGAGGSGGTGGSVVIIECDELVFPAGASITANGAGGNDGTDNGGANDDGGSGGGGGGGGGVVIIIANTVTSQAGTISVSGGAGGAGGTGGASGGGTGGAGGAGGLGRQKIYELLG